MKVNIKNQIAYSSNEHIYSDNYSNVNDFEYFPDFLIVSTQLEYL